jgi:hypothetical protein
MKTTSSEQQNLFLISSNYKSKKNGMWTHISVYLFVTCSEHFCWTFCLQRSTVQPELFCTSQNCTILKGTWQQDYFIHKFHLVMLTISKWKQKRSDIEAYYRNESKTFRFGPLKIGMEAERFGLVRIFLYQKQFVSVWPIGSGTKRTNLIWSKNCWRQSGTFLCNKKTYRSKQNILIWSAYYRN